MKIGDGIYRITHNSKGDEDVLLFFVKETSPDFRGFMMIFYGGLDEILYHKDRLIETGDRQYNLLDRPIKMLTIQRIFTDKVVEWKT